MVYVCNSTNTVWNDQQSFWVDGTIVWDAHRIGWLVAGIFAVVTTLVTIITVSLHAAHYQNRDEQRQVIRILLMPLVYAIVSFFSYRYFQEYTYYSVAETAYEAFTIAAFLLLLVHMVISSSGDMNAVLKQKDKRKLPFPFGFIRFRASKPYFMHTLKWSVLQYCLLRPLITIAAIICESYNVLCPQTYSVHFAEVYLDAVDMVSISIALYGLVVFYVLCKEELKGKKPLAKFVAIKLIVFFTFYQSFMFSILQSHGVIKATEYWTATNVSDGLSALCTCVEMACCSILMAWAYSYKEYTNPALQSQGPTGAGTFFLALWDAINFSDFFVEIWESWRFYIDWILKKPYTRSKSKFDAAFFPSNEDDDYSMKQSYNFREADNSRSPYNPYAHTPNHGVKPQPWVPQINTRPSPAGSNQNSFYQYVSPVEADQTQHEAWVPTSPEDVPTSPTQQSRASYHYRRANEGSR